MPSRIGVSIMALVVGAVVLFAACFNPGPTVVSQPGPLPPLGMITPITGDGATGAPEGVPASFVTTCGICHTVADAGTTGVIGPELTHIGTIAATERAAATGLSAEEYIRESILDPAAYISPGYTPLMTAGLHEVLGDDYEAVVAYLLSLTEETAEAPADGATDADAGAGAASN